MKSNVIFLFLVICFLQTNASAQPRLWELYTTSNQPFVNVIIERYQSDSIYIKFMDQSFVLHQDSIQYLVRKNSPHIGLGLFLGAVGGGVFGALISRDPDDGPLSGLGSGTITGGIAIGGVIGGAMGAASGADTKYQLYKLKPEKKRELLVKIFPGELAQE